MRGNLRTLQVLVIFIALFAGFAALMGLFYKDGSGSFEFTSLQGKKVLISGTGLYKNMSADVAIQGQAQDVITLMVAIPFVLLFALGNFKNQLRQSLILSGTLGYFLITYTFYLNMAAYNILFLVYAALMGLSFFSFYISVKEINKQQLYQKLHEVRPAFSGWILMIIPVMIGLLWLNIVVPPLIDGSVYPDSLQHYTTLIVQGNDLGMALPISLIVGILYMKRKHEGLLYAPVYLIFLSFLMLALIAKIIGMSTTGVSVGPPLVIIPVFWLISLTGAIMILKKC
ncbi:MAG: hypothetical protein ACM3ME_04635 [Chloroflexota bacterium]|nr:hypothetical protein [Lentimicrobium sp.]